MIKRVGIVIPTPDATDAMTRRCVELVQETTRGYDVDLQVIEGRGPGFRFSRSVNKGLTAARDADAWVLLNNDAWMDAGWLDALVATAEAHPEVGLVGAVLRYPRGGIQHAGGYIPLTPAEFIAAGIRHRAPFWAARRILANRGRPDTYMYAHWHRVSARHRLDFLTAACVLITRPCLEKIGIYDEAYEFGFEDTDHSLRAREAGFELAIARRATGIHHEGASRPLSHKGLIAESLFKSRWPASRVRDVTRRGGRTGVYHG